MMRIKAGAIMLLVAAQILATGAIKISAQTPTVGLTESYSNTIHQFDEITTEGLAEDFALPVKSCTYSANPVCSGTCNETLSEIELDDQQESHAPEIQPAPTIQQVVPAQAASDSANLDSEGIFNSVNQYRISLGLAPFEQETSVCELAQARSSEIIAETQNGTLHMGLYNRGLPYWIWENAKYGSDEEGTVTWWKSSPLHHQSIVGDYKYSCVKCTGSYCAQLFTSFAPK